MNPPERIHKHSSLPGDKGEITITCYVKDGHVLLNFGKGVSWLAMHADHARAMAEALLQRAEELDAQEASR
jgi:hypothetical protein